MLDTDSEEQRATGKVVVVTGASKGLGKQVALALAEEGANVAMLARTAADLEAARMEIINEVFAGGLSLSLSFSLSLSLSLSLCVCVTVRARVCV